MLRFHTLLLALLPLFTLAQNDAPILTLNTDMHTATISSIDSDAAGRYVLTASSDKTAKLWDAHSGQLLQTYRPPIAAGNEGRLFAGAISPDGNYVAVGGWSAYYPVNKTADIYIFHSHTGILQRRISGLPNVVLGLEFSPDGHFLAAALGGKNGIHIYDTQSWTVLKKDTDYAARSENTAFAPNGYLASVCDDGYVRLYDNDFNLIRKKKTSGGEEPYSIAFSPDGQKLALGYSDSPRIQVLNAQSLDLLYEPALGDADTNNDRLNKVAFSRDGQQLIAGGFYDKKQADGKSWYIIRIWEQQGQGSHYDYPAGKSTITDIKTLSNGNILYASFEPDWGVLDKRTGSKLTYQAATINDHKVSDRSHFKINTDGTQIGWTPVYQNALSFDVASRSLREQSVNYPAYQASTTQIKITDWRDSYFPRINGEAVSFLEHELCRSVDIANHGQSMVFGKVLSIQALDAAGDLLWRTPVVGAAATVNIAANNKVIAACQEYGDVRWYRMSDGELLLTLFVHPDRQRWVLWTPTGYYDASAGAEDLIGWHVNQGEDSEGLYYPISKFRSSYYRPDVIDRILQTVDEEKALRLADAAAQKNTTITRSVTETLPPSVRILSPSTGSSVAQNRVELSYSIKSPNNEQITGIKILVDGRPLSHERGLKPAGQRETVTVTIPSQDCTVSIIAENRFGASPANSIDLVWAGQTSMSRDLMKPNLYILAVGVGDYDNDDYDLDYADDDAEAFAAVLQKQEGLLYGQVETKLLTDKAATKDNILDGLDWLVRETTQHDVAMLFFAGHGVEDNRSTFYYLPVGADEEAMRRTCLMKTEIQETVATVTGKIVVFMDACHSGNMMMASTRRNNRDNPDITRIVNELIEAENGAVVFSSSTGRQTSLEDASWGHGAFTKALVEGLSGAAEIGNEGKITCKSLDIYISRRVKELTGGQQTPTTNYPPNVPDFPVSIKQ